MAAVGREIISLLNREAGFEEDDDFWTLDWEAVQEVMNHCIGREGQEKIFRFVQDGDFDKVFHRLRGLTTQSMAKMGQYIAKAYGYSGSAEGDLLLRAFRFCEYSLFKTIEQRILWNIMRNNMLGSPSKLIKMAKSIQNRRMARAGRSFEIHFKSAVEVILGTAYDVDEQTSGPKHRYDIVIKRGGERIVIVSLKTTLRERHHQAKQEATTVNVPFYLVTFEANPKVVELYRDDTDVRLVVIANDEMEKAWKSRHRITLYQNTETVSSRRLDDHPLTLAGMISEVSALG